MIPLCIERGRPTAAHAVGQRGWEVRLLRTLTLRVPLRHVHGRWLFLIPGLLGASRSRPHGLLSARCKLARCFGRRSRSPNNDVSRDRGGCPACVHAARSAFLWASPRAVRTSDIERTGEVAVCKVDLPRLKVCAENLRAGCDAGAYSGRRSLCYADELLQQVAWSCAGPMSPDHCLC